MKTYRIPCTWTVSATMEIQANSLGEAIEIANEAPLPTDTDYIEGSFEINNQIIPYLNKNRCAVSFPPPPPCGPTTLSVTDSSSD